MINIFRKIRHRAKMQKKDFKNSSFSVYDSEGDLLYKGSLTKKKYNIFLDCCYVIEEEGK